MRRPWRLMRKLGRQLLAGPYLVWMIGFILLPIVIILYYAFTNTSGAFTWDNIAAIADPVHVKSILLSLKLGFFCTVVCLLLAYPLAMILNSFHFKCSCSKFLSQILKIVVKNFLEIVPGKQTQKRGLSPSHFLTHSMRITLLIIIEFDPCIYAVKFNFIPFQVSLYQAADVIQNCT